MLVLIRGAGEIASGIALRLRSVGFDVVMTELDTPTAVCRKAAFAEAVRTDEQTVESVTARRAGNANAARELLSRGILPVLADPEARCCKALRPDLLVDAICAGENLGTKLSDAKLVVGVGAGFTAGLDCHAVIGDASGHTLGRVYYRGGVPAESPEIRFALERPLFAPSDGEFIGARRIGDTVRAGETVGVVSGNPVTAEVSGALRGLTADGMKVSRGAKVGVIDAAGRPENCYSASGKALAVAGGVLEALLKLGR